MKSKFITSFGVKKMTNQVEIQEQTLDCPHCKHPHSDIDEWALKPHRTHLCLNCNQLFEGSFKGVSRPAFEKLKKPANVVFVPF
jgi:transcription elongation factor Elf1